MSRRRSPKGARRRAALEAAEQTRAARLQAGKPSRYAEKKVRILPQAPSS